MPSPELAPVHVAPPARLGRYELIGHLATGGMAEIHLARLSGEAGFSKVVVVKRLLPELVASPAFVAMFLDEGKLVARLDHPNICEVFELGREGSEYFLAMPYLDGVAVHELIARPREPDRAAELRTCASVIAQACAGLHHAHELRDADGSPAHLVHRDISPSNLFVTTSGVVKVLDFGVAKVRGAAETEAGTIKGKTQYMAPEQLLGESLDRRADVFALGIVAFELATHQRLFKRASDYLSARAILEEPIPRADEVDPAIPSAVADVIAKALARDRAARFATAAELGTALEMAMRPHGGLASATELAAVVTASDELTQQRTRQQRVLDAARSRLSDVAIVPRTDALTIQRVERTTIDPRRRSRLPWIAAGIAAVAIAIVALGVAMSGRNDAPSRRDEVSDRDEIRERDSSRNDDGRTDSKRTPADSKSNDTRADSPSNDTRADSPSNDGRIDSKSTNGGTKPTNDVHADSKPSDPRATPGDSKSTPRGPGDNSNDSRRTNGPVAAKRGSISIDSTPFATIFIDGTRVDVTPVLNYSLSAGTHKLRAVLKDGRTKDVTLEIPAGRAAKPLTLTW